MTKFGAGPRYKDPVSGTEWANEHTFHIAYWMLNDLQIYQEMKKFMQNSNDPIPYRTWIKQMGLVDKSTTSGWKLMADGVHYGDLSEVMRASMYQFWAMESGAPEPGQKTSRMDLADWQSLNQAQVVSNIKSGVHVAGETTAELIFAPRTIWGELHGEVGGRIWRPGFAAFLVEKHVPLWVVTPVSHASKSNPAHTIISCNPDLVGPLEMNLMPFMASIFSNDSTLKEQAKIEGVLHEEKGSWWITDHEINHETVEEFDKGGEIEDRIVYSDTIYPSSKIYEMSFKLVPNCLRVSTMIYPNSFLNANGGIVWMRSLGIDVDVFSLTKFSADE